MYIYKIVEHKSMALFHKKVNMYGVIRLQKEQKGTMSHTSHICLLKSYTQRRTTVIFLQNTGP